MIKKSLYPLLGTLLLSSSVFAESAPSGNHHMGPPPSFSDMDTNGDGVLTSDELKGPMQRDFSQIDADNDGSVTESELDEFMKNHRPPEPPQNN